MTEPVSDEELREVYKTAGLLAARSHSYVSRLRHDSVPTDLLDGYESLVLKLRSITAELERATWLITGARSASH